MALINCPECQKEISDKTKNCPHCGYPFVLNDKENSQKIYNKDWNRIKDFNEWKPFVEKANKWSITFGIIFGIVMIIVFIIVFSMVSI
jgi:uncharacterized membrane protein YvbJ